MPALYRSELAHVCRRCRAPIAVGSVVIDRSRSIEEPASLVYHPACMIDVDPAGARRALDPDAEFLAYIPDGTQPNGMPVYRTRAWRGAALALPDRDALFALAAARAQRIVELSAVAKRKRSASPPSLEPDRSAVDALARDARGCPRVSLHFAFFGRDARWSDRSARVLIDASFRSPKREYVLAEDAKRPPPELPWQPYVGALCLWAADVALGRAAVERLVQWRVCSVDTPAFFVLGASSRDRDGCERAARAALDQAGFAADRALVCFADELCDESVASLAQRLDEHLALPSRAPATALDPRDAAVAELDRAVREGRVDAYASVLAMVKKRARRLSPACKSLAADAAVRALAHGPARKAALALIEALPPASDVSVMHALWREMYAVSNRMNSLSYALFEQLVRAKDGATTRVLFDALINDEPSEAASMSLMSLLHRCPNGALFEPMRAWSEALSDADPRKTTAQNLTAYLRNKPALR